ncbi:MAG: type IV pilus biogenesis protein PilP [Sulfuritalea sp.]|nr:type IV pilus biogenesis protein PilP [Sulfuritalea sp.]
MFNRKLIAAVIAAFVSSASLAGEGVAEEIARANEQIALLSAKLKELELRTQIAAKQAEMTRIGGTGAVMTSAQESELPVVRAIEGVDGRLAATLAFAGQIKQTVVTGEKTRGGWTVAQIDVGSVTLARGAERVRLGFGNEPSAPPAGQAGAVGQSANR